MQSRNTRGGLAVAATALAIGVVSFLSLDRRCALRDWPAPSHPAEMRELVRGALEMRGSPNDLARLQRLDEFVAVVADMPHWHGGGDVGPPSTVYSDADRRAFLADVALYYNDEWVKTAETYYYHLFWYARDFDSPNWSNNFLARAFPTISKYVLGAGIDLQTSGPYPVARVELQQLFHDWWAYEPFLLAAQDRTVLVAARRTSAVFGAAALVLLFLLGARLGGRVGVATGLVAAALLYESPIFSFYATRATVDVMLVAFLFACGLATSFFVPIVFEPVRTSADGLRVTGVVGLLGVLSGMTFGIKLNGALVGVGAALGCLLAGVLSLRGGGRGTLDGVASPGARLDTVAGRIVRTVGSLVATALLTFAIFFVFNPYYYEDAFGRFRRTLVEMREELAHCQRVLGPSIESRAEAVRSVYYYGAMLAGEYGDYMIVRSRPGPFQRMDRAGVVAPVRFWLRTCLVLPGLAVGLGVLAAEAWRHRGARAGLYCGVLGWSLAITVGSVLWLPLRWDRYMLVPHAPLILLVGYGWCCAASWVVDWVLSRVRTS